MAGSQPMVAVDWHGASTHARVAPRSWRAELEKLRAANDDTAATP
jgi:hypothetical protein